MCNDGTYLWIKLNIWVYGWILNFLHKVNFGISVLSRSKDCFSFNVQKKKLLCNLYYISLPMLMYQNTTKTNLLPLTTAYDKICYWMFMIHITVLCMIYFNGFHSISEAIYFQMYQNLILYSSSYHLRHSANNFFTPLVKKVFGKNTFKGIIYL